MSEDFDTSRARASLQSLLDTAHIPQGIRKALANEFSAVQSMLDKLEHGHLHIAVFGRVGVGKSALLNALLGEKHFSTSLLHGETREAQAANWEQWDAGGVFLIDTPGIDDVDGDARDNLAKEVAARSDVVLFVVDGDLTETELWGLQHLYDEHRIIILVLNKCDRYTEADRLLLFDSLSKRTAQLVPRDHLVAAAANPAERVYINIDEQGNEVESKRRPAPDVKELREKLWTILESEGKVLAALNASLFAGKLTDQIAQRMLSLKRDTANELIRNYCLAKGVVVGLNPVPIADLMAVGAFDISLVYHLSRVYGLPMTRVDAGKLIATISTQITLVMGTIWAIHFISSALKISTAGLSTVITGAAQGAVAYYSAYVVGEAAHRYLAQGLSWGPLGPKRVVQEILDGIDRNSLLADAREQILKRLHAD
jgi:GTPase